MAQHFHVITLEHAQQMREALEAIAAAGARTAVAGVPLSPEGAAAMGELARAALLPPELHPPERRDTTDDLVTVCSSCKRATCWQGLFYCGAAKTAGVVEMTVKELTALGLESPRYWTPVSPS